MSLNGGWVSKVANAEFARHGLSKLHAKRDPTRARSAGNGVARKPRHNLRGFSLAEFLAPAHNRYP